MDHLLYTIVSMFKAAKTSALLAAMLFLIGCARVPNTKNLQGGWEQDPVYSPSTNLLERFIAAVECKEYEVYFRQDRVAFSRLEAKTSGLEEQKPAPESDEPDLQRIYWESPYTLTTGTSRSVKMHFQDAKGESQTATLYYKKKHLVMKWEKERIGLIQGPVTNLKIKGYTKPN